MGKIYALITKKLCELGYHQSTRHAGNPDTQVEAFEVWIHPTQCTIRIVQIFRAGKGCAVYRPVTPRSSAQNPLNAIA